MGAAKNRGTFEERKAQALTAGRIKEPTKSINRIMREFQAEMITGNPMVDAATFINVVSNRER